MRSKEVAQRQKRLLDQLKPDGVAIIAAANEVVRSGDAHYLFRQNSDFYYLTGFDEPDAIAVFAPGRKEGEYILFNRRRNPEREVWDGPRAGQDGAVKDYGANQAFAIDEVDTILPEILQQYQKIYCQLGREASFDQRVMTWVNTLRRKVRAGVNTPSQFVNVGDLLHEMRLIKDGSEIKSMRYACQVSAKAQAKAMQVCRPGMMEYQLGATMLSEYLYHGCTGPAYNPIIGGGKNACVLHYVKNNHELKDGDLVLVDAGAEYNYYAADITRTYPVNGRFSDTQKAIYDLVLEAQLAGIAAVKPGNVWFDYHNTIVEVLVRGLVKLGILQGEPAKLIESQAYTPYYMHYSGHWLGLDVHDVGAYKINNQWRPLQPGMVLTVEPGLYFSETIKGLNPKWRNIGVRIEDDVVVTENGCEVLTKDVPKEISAIEVLMKNG
jgi:Xaa-Pro aminopeptidase